MGLHLKPPFLLWLLSNFRIVGNVRLLFWGDWPAQHKGKIILINGGMDGWRKERGRGEWKGEWGHKEKFIDIV